MIFHIAAVLGLSVVWLAHFIWLSFALRYSADEQFPETIEEQNFVALRRKLEMQSMMTDF